MGGCCCGASRTQINGTPVYYYCPQVEEREPLSYSHGAASALSSGFLVDTNLDTSSPDTYRAPPAPMPYDSDFGRPQTPPSSQESRGYKIDLSIPATGSQSLEDIISGNTTGTPAKDEDLKELRCKSDVDSVLPSSKETEIESPKLSEYLSTIEEEDCPICLEEYDAENPRIVTKCDHHFHLACILEWMERSDTCPVCDQETIFDDNINE